MHRGWIAALALVNAAGLCEAWQTLSALPLRQGSLPACGTAGVCMGAGGQSHKRS
jgi:hypothetical protein